MLGFMCALLGGYFICDGRGSGKTVKMIQRDSANNTAKVTRPPKKVEKHINDDSDGDSTADIPAREILESHLQKKLETTKKSYPQAKSANQDKAEKHISDDGDGYTTSYIPVREVLENHLQKQLQMKKRCSQARPINSNKVKKNDDGNATDIPVKEVLESHLQKQLEMREKN
ncbi:hypothetical protein BX667DRAFT_494285 [Coemansia mojavensis]|nr:hypothetical protein BX667DRAFT_494285 [Coemansia mojavensis]